MESPRLYAKATANHGPRGRTRTVRHPAFLQRRRQPKAIAMLYRGIEYSVVQGIERRLWKWAATVAGTKISGQGSRGTRR
jgi:hypothetical protein